MIHLIGIISTLRTPPTSLVQNRPPNLCPTAAVYGRASTPRHWPRPPHDSVHAGGWPHVLPMRRLPERGRRQHHPAIGCWLLAWKAGHCPGRRSSLAPLIGLPPTTGGMLGQPKAGPSLAIFLRLRMSNAASLQTGNTVYHWHSPTNCVLHFGKPKAVANDARRTPPRGPNGGPQLLRRLHPQAARNHQLARCRQRPVGSARYSIPPLLSL